MTFATDGNRDARLLEEDLRERLRAVELVCEADLPLGLLDEAELVVRHHFQQRGFEVLGQGLAATYISYVAMRGAERYEGNRLWPQLGVEEQSQLAGRAVLRALRQLGLPDFQEMVRRERARTYVAPILIHGGIPASSAHRLVQRVEADLRRGLVDGKEEVRNLARDGDLVQDLGRPAARLIKYVPEFAAALLDAVIDHVGGVADGGHRLPRHLLEALAQGDGESRKGLRRIVLPVVEIDLWSGFGPEVELSAGAERWTIELDGERVLLASGERSELKPSASAFAVGAGRRITLWTHPVTWFDGSGRLIRPDELLPRTASVVLPSGWTIEQSDGCQPKVIEDGVPLSGPWSAHRSCTLLLPPGVKVTARPPGGRGDAVGSWSVSGDIQPELIGPTVAGVTTDSGGPVFSEMPALRLFGDGQVPVWFTRQGDARTTAGRLDAPGDQGDLRSLATVLPSTPIVGTLEVRDGSGIRRGFDVAVVPGLEVDLPQQPVGPQDAPTIAWRYQSQNSGDCEGQLIAPADADEVVIPVPGLRGGALKALLPRIRWGLRRGGPHRLELAADVIRAEVTDLIDDEVWVIVRCGVDTSVRLEVWIDGRHVQERDGKAQRASGKLHQTAFSLAPLRDTLRHAGQAAIELRVVVSGTSLPVVRAGASASGKPAVQAERSWAPRQVLTPDSTTDAWNELDWWNGRYSPAAAAEGIELAARQTLASLRGLSRRDQVVAFVRALGRGSHEWVLPGRGGRSPLPKDAAWGPGGGEWAIFSVAADKTWQLEGVRYRQFSGPSLDAKLISWARAVREKLRRAAPFDRAAIERFSFGRSPDLQALATWWHIDWVRAATYKSANGATGVDQFTGILLFHLLALAGGDEDAGPVIAEAVDLAPSATLELVAFLLEATRQGIQLHAPPVGLDSMFDQDDDDDDDGAWAPGPWWAPPLENLVGCDLSVSDYRLSLRLPPDRSAPILRVWSLADTTARRALGLLFPDEAEGDGFYRLPTDLHGRVGLSIPAIDPDRPPRADELRIVDLAAERTGARVEARAESAGDLRLALATLHLERAVMKTVQLAPAERDIEQLFEDEVEAGRALVQFCATSDEAAIDRLAIAILPAILLFETLRLTPDALETMWRRSELLWALAAARRPADWRRLGWSNPDRFDAGPAEFEDVVAFATSRDWSERGLAPQRTHHYGHRERGSVGRRMEMTFGHLEKRGVPKGAIALITATHRAATDDLYAVEAVRLLLHAQRESPKTTKSAVLVGLVLSAAIESAQHRSPE